MAGETLNIFLLIPLFLELERTFLFLSSPLAQHGKVAKSLSLMRLAIKQLFVSVDVVVDL